MKIPGLSLSLGLLLVWTSVAAAVCSSTQECLQTVASAQGDARTMTADFTQVKHLSLLEEPIISSGHLLVKRPDRVLVRIDKPQPVTVRINNGQLEIPGLAERDRQALSMVPIAGMGDDLGAIFSGSVAGLQEKFEVSAAGDQTGISVRLAPRDTSLRQTFRSIEIRFDGPQLLIHQIRLDDALGDTLEITLDNVRRNIDIPDSMFTGKDG